MPSTTTARWHRYAQDVEPEAILGRSNSLGQFRPRPFHFLPHQGTFDDADRKLPDGPPGASQTRLPRQAPATRRGTQSRSSAVGDFQSMLLLVTSYGTSGPDRQGRGYIEANLNRRLTLEDVAGRVGYSPHHFLRLFWAVTGETPGAYIRNRRLAEAARLLAEREDRILDIALEYQYQSQAALTRSFKRATGGGVDMDPRFEERGKMMVVGMIYYGENKNNEIAGLWQRFNPRCPAIPNVKDGSGAYGVCLRRLHPPGFPRQARGHLRGHLPNLAAELRLCPGRLVRLRGLPRELRPGGRDQVRARDLGTC